MENPVQFNYLQWRCKAMNIIKKLHFFPAEISTWKSNYSCTATLSDSECWDRGETQAPEANRACGHKYNAAERNGPRWQKAIGQISCESQENNHSPTLPLHLGCTRPPAPISSFHATPSRGWRTSTRPRSNFARSLSRLLAAWWSVQPPGSKIKEYLKGGVPREILEAPSWSCEGSTFSPKGKLPDRLCFSFLQPRQDLELFKCLIPINLESLQKSFMTPTN